MIEIFKDIPGYEGIYQVSNLGNVKSLKRMVSDYRGERMINERIRKPIFDNHGYLSVILSKNRTRKYTKIHQLVCIAFLNHKPNGHKLVIRHKNHIPNDNRLNNLEIATHRKCANKKHIISTSEFVGVSWAKERKKWLSGIRINGKTKYLGYFIDEYNAHLAYQKALSNLVT